MWAKCYVLSVVILGLISKCRTQDDLSGIISSARIVSKLYEDCSTKSSILLCLKMKAITIMDRAGRSNEISLNNYITLVRDSSADNRDDTGRSLTENDLELILASGGSEAKENKLTDILVERVARFFRTHTLRLSVPKLSTEEISRGMEEGRGKMKKMMNMMMMAGAMKMMMLVPLAVIVLFLLAGKALIISKVALVLALIITLKKLLSAKNDGGHEHGWSQGGGGHGGGGWDKRSMDNANDVAHDIAYNAYKSI